MEGEILRSLVWSKRGPERLFGACLQHGQIFEVDLERMERCNECESLGGPVWGMDINSNSTTLAVGCEDGTLRLFDVSGGSIAYARALATVPGRVLAVRWHPTDPSSLYTAGADGVVRRWEVPMLEDGTGLALAASGASLPLLHFAVDKYGHADPPMVWSIAVLADHTVVSGDSQVLAPRGLLPRARDRSPRRRAVVALAAAA